LGCSLFARHYSGSRDFFPFLWVLRCFSSPACLFTPYVFRREYHRITSGGFPHSEIPGSKVGQHLTRAYRSRPRPSSALGAKASTVCPYSLDREELITTQLWSFQGAHGLSPSSNQPEKTACVAAGLSKLNSKRLCPMVAADIEVDVDLGEPRITDDRHKRNSAGHRRAGQPPEYKSSGIPRKEVIQPQLPLRLPCYDFTPIINPTFDGSLPYGLGHRLRVLPTFVV
jgi:hypothetical protein